MCAGPRTTACRASSLPGVSPDTPWIDPLFTKTYDPLWAVCQDLEMPVTHHSGGSGIPDYPKTPVTTLMFIMESGFFANRALWHLIMSGVFERFPGLVFAHDRARLGVDPRRPRPHGRSARADGRRPRRRARCAAKRRCLAHKPSDYFRRNCFVGASFPSPSDAEAFEKIGLDRIMWGSDYPHHEATFPYSRESIRRSFVGWSEENLRKIFAENAARVYGFDLAKLAPLADEFGPTVSEIATPLDKIPAKATSPSFFRK